jgi:lipopolysaccharide transport system permease protein
MTAVFESMLRFRRVLYASTRAELLKRYAGSLLGPVWPILYPLLFLSAYLFLWMVVFNLRFPGLGRLSYVLYVFGGLIPFLFMSEALTAGVLSIRQNIQLVKSVIMPLELIPVRAVLVALSSHVVGLALLAVLSGINGTLSWHLLLLPAVLALMTAGLIGAAWIVASLGVLLPDLAQLVNLAIMLLMFVSPIGFTPDMVPPRFRFALKLNPVSYIVDVYRGVFVASYVTPAASVAVFTVMCLSLFWAGAYICARFKSVVVDLE